MFNEVRADRFAPGPSALRLFGWLAAAALVAVAALGPSTSAALAKGPPGNNGTVKIHDGAGEPSSEVRNEPHVSRFHLHFYFADPYQAGDWRIEEWSPGEKGATVLSGAYDTSGDGEDRQPSTGSYELPDGHYKLFWGGDVGKQDKHKTFWVEYGVQPGWSAAPSGSILPGGSILPTASVLEATSTPRVTLPPTDATGGGSAPTGGSWRAVLLVLVGIVATALLLSPSRARHPRR